VRELLGGDPQRVGPYRLVGRLGAGGMGVVFAGRSAGGRLVAVKVIRAELAEDAEFRLRFSREVAAARSVSGMFTAPVVDADVDGPVPWLATAYVAGPSLSDAVRSHGPLPASSVLALAAGLAEGLSAIHAAGLIHRDLKPSNVLLAEDGPRVIDFGISRAAEATALTHTDLVIGSPGFMSPEQAQGGRVGPATDVFSLGAVLAFVATGKEAFGTGSTAALVYRVVHGPPDLSGVPAEVGPLIERCLAKDPGSRPTTAELLAELDGIELTPGWLPGPITEDLVQRAADSRTWLAALPGKLSAEAEPEPGPRTVTVPGPGQEPGASLGQPAPVSPLGVGPRRRRRPVMLVLLLAGILAVAAAGTAAALGLFAGNPAGKQPGAPQADPTVHRSRTPAATASPGSPSQSEVPTASVSAGPVPRVPTNVTATALNQDTIRVTWTDNMADVTGFQVNNGCGTDGCGGGAINVQTGRVTAADITTTPGAYQCFAVLAFNAAGASEPAPYACTSTPGINMPTDARWTDTGVTLIAGDIVGITASGNAYLASAGSTQTPAGDWSCRPATDHAAQSAEFPAPQLTCWSLIARIGTGPPFEVGSSLLFTATAGRLYIGVNDDSFAGNTGNWAVHIKVGGLS
jgi:Protein kinase domain